MSILEGPQIVHELWRERRTAEVWAVELRNGVVSGCFGPLHRDDLVAAFLPTFAYAPEEAPRIEATRDGFDLVDPAGLDP